MVHPTHLLRSDSERDQGFSAPLGNYYNEIDCGVTALPCLVQRLHLQKLAKLSVFLIVLCILGLLHGIISTYFKGTSHLWFSHYNFPSLIEDWFVFMTEMFVGSLALIVSYWGDRLHRVTCIGALTMLTAVSGTTLAIPEVYNPFSNNEIFEAITGPALCKIEHSDGYTKDILGTEGFNEVTFGYFFIFQFMFSMVTISIISHGLSYVDDHVSPKHSPALLGLALASHEAGKQFGIYFSWVPYVLKIISIFSSPVWLVFMVLTFITGCAIAMFPKVLPNMVIKKSVNSLVSIASGGIPLDEVEEDLGFWKSIWILLKNKVLLLNIISFALIQSGLVNFGLFEKYFNQSKYHVPLEDKDSTGYSDPDIIQFTTTLLRQPLVAISMITSGMVISKLRPKPRNLIIYNITTFTLVALIFSSTLFWDCTSHIQNEHKHIITIPYCSSTCSCPVGESFQPVCVDGKTYFSPCLAGCKNYSITTAMYQNCSCGLLVTDGSCDVENCKFVLALAQVNNILANGLLASTFIVNILITLRSVSTKLKAAALGLTLSFVGTIPFLPVKMLYHVVANQYCEIHTQKGCQYFSDSFPMVLSSLTLGLMGAAVLLSFILLCFITELNLYTNEYARYDTEINNHPMTSNEIDPQINTPAVSERERARVVEEHAPFLRQLSERVKRKLKPLSREDRIKNYLNESELVSALPKKKSTLRPAPKPPNQSEILSPVTVHADQNGETKSRPGSRNSNLRNSRASAESDMSSLYRIADIVMDPTDGSESEPSIKVSQGKIVFQNIPSNVPLKRRKQKEPVIIGPDKAQPNRPAPVPDFMIETSF